MPQQLRWVVISHLQWKDEVGWVMKKGHRIMKNSQIVNVVVETFKIS